MAFDVETVKKKFDMHEVIYSLNMEDVFNVIEDAFTDEEKERICSRVNPATIQHKLEIDWYEEIRGFLSARYLNNY